MKHTLQCLCGGTGGTSIVGVFSSRVPWVAEGVSPQTMATITRQKWALPRLSTASTLGCQCKQSMIILKFNFIK